MTCIPPYGGSSCSPDGFDEVCQLLPPQAVGDITRTVSRTDQLRYRTSSLFRSARKPTRTPETARAVQRALRERTVDGGDRPLVADDGGFAPPVASVDGTFALLETAVRDAGHEPSPDDVASAVDVAATHFYATGAGEYRLESLDRTLDLVAGWAGRHPLVAVEDPLAEDDRERSGAALQGRVQVLGDDLPATSVGRVEQAVEENAASAVLVKANRAGTLTRTLEVVGTARDAGLATVAPAQSGETCDTTIVDLAVGVGAGQVKTGPLARSERLCKYNRLLGIGREAEAGYAGGRWPPADER